MARTIIGDSTALGGLNVYGSIQVGGNEVVDATGSFTRPGVSTGINSQTVLVYDRDENDDVLYASGTATLNDGAAGYAKGCLYIDTNVGAGTSGLYENVGTTTACNFDLIGSAGGATVALDNLAAVAINTSLVSDTTLTDDLGSSGSYWLNGWVQTVNFNATADIAGTGAGVMSTTGNIVPSVDSTDDLGSSVGPLYYANAYVDTVNLNPTAAIDGTVAGTSTFTGNAVLTSGNLTLSSGNLVMTDGTVNLVDATTTSGTSMTLNPSAVTTGTGVLIDGTSVTTGDVLRVNINSVTMGGTGSAISVVDMHTTTEVFAVREDGRVLMQGTAEGTTAAEVQSGDLVVSDGDLTVSGGETILISDAANADVLSVRQTDGGAIGVIAEYHHDSSSPAINDVITRINYSGEDDGSNKTVYGRMDATILDETDTTEDGRLGWSVLINNSLTELLRLDNVGVSLMASTLVVGDGGATITSSGDHNINIQTGNATTGVISIIDGAAGDIVLQPDTTGKIAVGSGGNDATISSSGNFDLVLQTGNASTGSITIKDGAAEVIILQPATSGEVEVRSVDGGAVGPVLRLSHQGGSQANADVVGRILFTGEDDAVADEDYGRIDVIVDDISAANPDSDMSFAIDNQGTLTERLRLLHTVNAVAVGDGATSGMLQSSGNQDLVLRTGNTTTSDISIIDGANGNIEMNMNGSGDLVVDGDITNTGTVGTPGTNVTAKEYGDGRNHVTVLTLTNADLGAIGGAGNLAVGALIYTFPAGAHVHEVTYSSVALQGDAAIQADTPDCGIGSVIGSGAIAALNGTTMEDYITGFAATDCNGSVDVNMSAAVAGVMTGISMNMSGHTKTVHYNAADNWAGASTSLLATGTVTLKWTAMS